MQVLGYQILSTCNQHNVSQCSQETVMVILVCLSQHNQIRTQSIVHYTVYIWIVLFVQNS